MAENMLLHFSPPRANYVHTHTVTVDSSMNKCINYMWTRNDEIQFNRWNIANLCFIKPNHFVVLWTVFYTLLSKMKDNNSEYS